MPAKKNRVELPKYRQNLLSGAPSVKGSNVLMYSQPRDAHQRFMNAFFQACDITLTKEECQQRGTHHWSQIKRDAELQAKFITSPPEDRLKLLNISVRPHPTVHFFGGSSFEMSIPEVTENKTHDSVPHVDAALPDPLSGFLQLINVDATVFKRSDLLLKPDFAKPLIDFAKCVMRELTLTKEWQDKYSARASHLQRTKPAPALERSTRVRDAEALVVGKALVELCRLKEEAADPASRSIVAINFGLALAKFPPMLALLLDKVRDVRERWNDRARNATRIQRVVPLPQVEFFCQQSRTWESTIQILEDYRVNKNAKTHIVAQFSHNECLQLSSLIIECGVIGCRGRHADLCLKY